MLIKPIRFVGRRLMLALLPALLLAGGLIVPGVFAPQNALAQSTAGPTSAQIKAAQRDLATLGYYSGSANGQESSGLTRAIEAFQKDRDLKRTGKVTKRLGTSLDSAIKKAEFHGKRVTLVESMLSTLKYSPGRKDGKEDASLTSAIKKFQQDRGNKQSGKVDGRLIVSLRSAFDKEGLKIPREAFTLSKAPGKTGTKKKSSSTKRKTSTASKKTDDKDSPSSKDSKGKDKGKSKSKSKSKSASTDSKSTDKKKKSKTKKTSSSKSKKSASESKTKKKPAKKSTKKKLTKKKSKSSKAKKKKKKSSSTK